MKRKLKRMWRRLGLVRLELLEGACEKAGALAAVISLLVTAMLFFTDLPQHLHDELNSWQALGWCTLFSTIFVALILLFFYGQLEVTPRLHEQLERRWAIRDLKKRPA